MISLIVFNIRNIHRINNELNIAKNIIITFKFPFYWVDKVSFNKLNFKLNYVLEGKSYLEHSFNLCSRKRYTI